MGREEIAVFSEFSPRRFAVDVNSRKDREEKRSNPPFCDRVDATTGTLIYPLPTVLRPTLASFEIPFLPANGRDNSELFRLGTNSRGKFEGLPIRSYRGR